MRCPHEFAVVLQAYHENGWPAEFGADPDTNRCVVIVWALLRPQSNPPQGRCRPPANRLNEPHAPVAQLDRALPSEGKGHTFESCRVRQSVRYIRTMPQNG